jgi:hypothetical protein
MTKGSSKKASPDSDFQLSMTTVEEQGILESFFKLPQTERKIVRQLLEKCGPQHVGVVRLPVPFGPKKFKERRNFLLPVYKLIRYHRLTFDSIADGALFARPTCLGSNQSHTSRLGKKRNLSSDSIANTRTFGGC